MQNEPPTENLVFVFHSNDWNYVFIMTINQSRSYYNSQLSRLSQYVVTIHLQSLVTSIPSFLLLLVFMPWSQAISFSNDIHRFEFWNDVNRYFSAQKWCLLLIALTTTRPKYVWRPYTMLEVLKWDQKLSYTKIKFIFKIHLNNHRSDECCNSFEKDVNRIIFHVFLFYYY